MAVKNNLNRRAFAGALGTLLFAPGLVRAQETDVRTRESDGARRNVSSFSVHDWRDHFEQLGKGIIISDTITRVLQHWTKDGEMRLYPTSVPLTDELTKRGYTEVVEKRKNPGWAPTPSMRPGMARLRSRGRPHKSARYARPLSVMAVLPYSRHCGHPQDRAQIVKRLHRSLQYTNRRGL
mgnify:CR=1 FL=1